MKTKKLLYLTLILTNCFFKTTVANKINDSLIVSKSNAEIKNPIFLLSVGYKLPINKNIILNSGHGLYIECGINLGKFISKKTVIGIYAGWSFKDVLWSTSFNSKFVSDYKTAINNEVQHSYLDSSIINSSANLINNAKGNDAILPGCSMKSFHNYTLYYGILIKLPYRYIPAIKIYTGTNRSYYMGDGNIATFQKDYNIFELRRKMLGCELIVFKGIQSLTCKKNKFKNIGVVSVYYEMSDFSKSNLYFNDGENERKISLQEYTNQSFLKKYKKDVSWGLKLSYSIM